LKWNPQYFEVELDFVSLLDFGNGPKNWGLLLGGLTMMFFWRQRFKLPPWRVCWEALLQHDAAKKMRFQDVDIIKGKFRKIRKTQI
jgi:hypothetical protein